MEFYLPAGTWTNLLTGEEVDRRRVAPRAARLRHRCRSTCGRARCIPWGARSDRPDYDYLDGLAAAGVSRRATDGAGVTVTAPDGRSARFTVVDGEVQAEGQADWRAQPV